MSKLEKMKEEGCEPAEKAVVMKKINELTAEIEKGLESRTKAAQEQAQLLNRESKLTLCT
jgi:hypothetical protein